MENDISGKGKERVRKKLPAEWFGIAPLLLLSLGAFALWGFNAPHKSVLGVVLAAAALLLFTLGLILAVPNAFAFFGGEAADRPAEPGERSRRRGRMHPILGVVLMALLSRTLLLIAAYVISLIANGYTGTFFKTLPAIWMKNGANADLVGQGTFFSEYANNCLVLPLYPIIVKGMSFITGSDFASGMILNTLFSCGTAAAVYELALTDMGRRSARMAVFFAFAMPAAVFLAVPDCMALFMLLVSLSLLFMRKGKFWLAGLFGGLASFTHIWGILLIVPYTAEALAHAVKRFKTSGKEGFWKVVLSEAGFMLLIPLGFFGYMLFTRIVLGSFTVFVSGDPVYLAALSDPLTRARLFADTLLFGRISNAELLGQVLPGLLYFFGALVLFVASARTLRTSYTLWFVACFAVSGLEGFGTIPLLFTVTLAAPIALAHLCDSRDDGAGAVRAQAKAAAAGSVLLVGQILYLIMFAAGY